MGDNLNTSCHPKAAESCQHGTHPKQFESAIGRTIGVFALFIAIIIRQCASLPVVTSPFHSQSYSGSLAHVECRLLGGER